MANNKVAIIGSEGWVGRAYQKVFPDAIRYDEPLGVGTKDEVNQADIAIICVPTDAVKEGDIGLLNTSIVEEVVTWLETPLILIKSALQPGTTDRLVKKYKKRIAVSVEMVGEGKYFVPYWKYPHTEDPTYHSFLVVGGEEETAKACADVLWQKMSPDTNIYLLNAIEAEICKLMENFWGAQKVTFANTMYDICQMLSANYTKVLQAWGADGRVEKMHMRVVPGKRGWKSKCYDKDIPALAAFDESGFMEAVIKANRRHLKQNDKQRTA